MTSDFQLFINGEFKETREKVKLIDPSTGRVIASAVVAGASEVELALASAREASDNGAWPRLSLVERKEYLLKISKGILTQAQELASLESSNTGKPIKETTFMDIPSSAKVFEDMANNLEAYLKDETREVSSGASKAGARLIREPRGVVVLIVPWNYPLLIACWKLAQSLAAGNTVILKPSSLTPLTVLSLAKIIQDTGIPAGVVNIINAGGGAVGEQLCSDKRVDMISFTGSNSVGKKILSYANQNIKKTIMELGGKSAGIILKDADLELAVNGSLCSIFLNQGQMCTAMSRILIQDDVYGRFSREFIDKAKKIKLGKGNDYQAQMGPLISQEQRRKVSAFINKAVAEGAKIACGGDIPEDADLKNGFFFQPTVLTDVSQRASIFQEEVFGPVVCLGRFSEAAAAAGLANNSDFGLACSIWSKDTAQAQELAAKINAGIVWINTYGMFFNQLPYGGFKQSGFGKELGREGFLEHTRLKNVITDKTKDSRPLINYWYGF